MRLLLLNRSSNAGGGTTWCMTLATGLAERGHTVKVIFTRLGQWDNFMHKRMRDTGMLVNGLCYGYQKDAWPILLAAYIDSFQPDRVFVDNRERMREVAQRSVWLSAGAAKIMFICHCHGVPHSEIEEVKPWLHKVVCVSEASAPLVAAYDPVVIRNAVHPAPDDGTDVRAKFGIPPEAFLIGYVGRHDSNKNTQSLYEAFKDTDWWLLLAGRNAPKPPSDLAEEAKRRVVVHDGEVEMPGAFYRGMDVFVLPSKSEGFPLAPLEALLSRTRVAMTRTSDYPSLFEKAIGFFDYGDVDGMRQAIADAPGPEMAQRIIANQLTVDRMLKQYEAVLR